jgi:hypothetical protein
VAAEDAGGLGQRRLIRVALPSYGRSMGSPGAIVMFGSGETAAVGRAAMRWLADTGRAPSAIAVLETPAGFEVNAADVAARWGDFLRRQPEARGAELAQLPLRQRGTALSPDDADLARPLLGADLIVLGAGSPTYAVRQLHASVTWEYARAAHLLGASFFLASAAAIAAGACALPVYEIYKVGEDPHWKEGLRLFDAYGLRLAAVTHWDNQDGGAGLDTSRCYMGRERFDELHSMLPEGVVIVGIDEHTALAVDPAAATASVLGRGGVTVIRDGKVTAHANGATFPLGEIGPFALPDIASEVRPDLASAVEAARAQRSATAAPPREVAVLIASRDRARAAKDFVTADRLRDEIAERGWVVEDTRGRTRVIRSPR